MADCPHGSDATASTVAVPFPALPQDLTICSATETRQLWMDWWHACGHDADGSVDADASAVESIDGAGLQLLVALHHWLHRHGLALVLSRPSQALHAACTTLGLTMLLSDTGAA